MDNENKHGIILNNMKNGETVSYSALLIQGFVEDLTTIPCKVDTTCNVIKIETKSNIFQTLLLNRAFKCLIEIEQGINGIVLKHCCCSKSITIIYKPRATNVNVIPLYIICEGESGNFQAPQNTTSNPQSACNRILTGCKLLQCLLAEKLNDHGFGRKTFQIQSDTCTIFKSKLHYEKVRKMEQLELWENFAREIMYSKIGSDKTKYLAFLSSTYYNGDKFTESLKSHDELIGITEAYVAYGGGGLALLGTACLYTWPENVFQAVEHFEDATIVDKREFLDDSCYRGTYGTCFSTTLGSALHELCHTFDLGHSTQGIMGRGFDNVQSMFVIQNNSEAERIIKHQLHDTRGYGVKQATKEELIYWSHNSLNLLAYHKWFNDLSTIKGNILKFNEQAKVLHSTAGIRVIEIRNPIEELVLHAWVFTSKILKHSFQIPCDTLETLRGKNVIIVVEDSLDSGIRFDTLMSVSNGGIPSIERRTYFNTQQLPFPEVIDSKINTHDFLEASKNIVSIVGNRGKFKKSTFLLEKLGKVFAPVRYDMSGNIEKITKKYNENRKKNEYLEDMVLAEKSEGGITSTDALQWLRRGLHFLVRFFECIVTAHEQGTLEEGLATYLQMAYKETLEQYHGWVAAHIFNVSIEFSRTVVKSFKEILWEKQFEFNVVNMTSNLKNFVTKVTKSGLVTYVVTFLRLYLDVLKQISKLVCRFSPTRADFFYTLALEKNYKDDYVLRDMQNFAVGLSSCIQHLCRFYDEHGLETQGKV